MMDSFLKTRRPVLIKTVQSNQVCGIHAKRNPYKLGNAYASEDASETKTENLESCDFVIPPLNTDLRFREVLPEYIAYLKTSDVNGNKHPHELHVHDHYDENFSWHEITPNDSQEIVAKKKLIHPIQNQHMCGSCWAMAIAAVVSDCFVVSGVVDWMPNIAPTFIMMAVNFRNGNGQCNGGNPASVALALETTPVSDASCIDYSWCSNDTELCTSSSAAHHFASTLGDKLNQNIPTSKTQSGACYFAGEKHSYVIDQGTEALFINHHMPAELFRSYLKAHLIDFGPVVAGYAVLRNFVGGEFTNPQKNQGIYFERANYTSLHTSSYLYFDDIYAYESQVVGLHAVRIVGWGIGKNVQYDNDKYGDVPYWVAANSWGPNWGHTNGYFKMAMYPYNKFAQFGKQISVKGTVIGGIILIRATKKPTIQNFDEISSEYLNVIKRTFPDSFYKGNAKQGPIENPQVYVSNNNWKCGILVIVSICVIVVLIKYKKFVKFYKLF